MVTRLFEIKFIDGRTYRVFCANRTQIDKFLRCYNTIKEKTISMECISSGIHETAMFLKIMESEK